MPLLPSAQRRVRAPKSEPQMLAEEHGQNAETTGGRGRPAPFVNLGLRRSGNVGTMPAEMTIADIECAARFALVRRLEDVFDESYVLECLAIARELLHSEQLASDRVANGPLVVAACITAISEIAIAQVGAKPDAGQ